MINVYKDEDYEKARNLKKKLLIIYFVLLGVCLCACAVFFTLFMFMPYASTKELIAQKNLYMFLDCAISIVFVIFSFVYLGIPYKRAKYYFKMLDDVKTGHKQKNVSTFLQNDMKVVEVGNVDYHTMVVLEWSDKTQEYMRRNVLVDKEKEMPKLNNGDIIVYVTHANVLLSYGLASEEEIFETI